MVEWLDSWIAQVGPIAYLVLALAATIEYIFPPFPGDTVMLLGGVYAVRGQKPWVLVFLALTIGSVAGAAIDYWVGTKLYQWLEHRPDDKPFLGFTKAQLHAAEAKMRKRGTVLVLLNRFLPGIRGVIFFAAGAAQMPKRRALVLGAVSAAAWNGLVLGAGIAVGGNAEKLERLLRQYSNAVYVLLALAALGVGIRYLVGRLKTRRPGNGAP
ncbi:MAG TPA: DedA family protein [Myxococcaceae bacterium]|nr:DedA family protein [Myxococcaceae bacterium]